MVAPPVPGPRPAHSSSRRGRSSSVSGGVSPTSFATPATATAASARAATHSPPKSSGNRKGDTNARLRRDQTVNGPAAHPLPLGALGGGTGLASAERRWTPTDRRDVVYNGGDGDGGGGGGGGGGDDGGGDGEDDGGKRGRGEGGREEGTEGGHGAGAGAKAGASSGQAKEAVHDNLPLLQPPLEKTAFTANDSQGSCDRLLHGENYGELCMYNR